MIIMSGFQCPYCSMVMTVSNDTASCRCPSFDRDADFNPQNYDSSTIKLAFFKCPNYIPEAIRNDYQEACAIINLSPKASATLSRRCLQGMIRDFWDIKESNLAQAIEKLEGKIPAPQWKVIDGVRRIGNIGAHMEKDINLIVDIEPDEAQKLIKLIEHLLEQWYINRHEQELLYADIIGIDKSKQSERKKTE